MLKDIDNKENLQVKQEFFNALKNGNEEDQQQAFLNFTNAIENNLMEKAQNTLSEYKDSLNDEQILINRGVLKPLTKEENKFFNEVVERGGFKGVEEAFPVTLIDDVLNRVRTEHPIISKVDVMNITGLAKILIATNLKAKAFWGPIDSTIKQVVLDGFKMSPATTAKLSGFIPVPKGYIELGPAWLATYVKEVLFEAMSASLEIGIVQGKGAGANEPIGMLMKLTGALDGEHSPKDKIELESFDALSLVGIRAALASVKQDNGEVEILVNPKTYYSKVFKALAFRADNGTWVNDRLATGENIVPSHAVPEDTLIVGVLKNYLLAVSSDVKITEYRETLAIEDMDLYIAKFFGTGTPKNPNSFLVADLSAVEGITIPEIELDAEV